MVGLDNYSTYEMHSIGVSLGAFPIIILFSFFYGEMPHAYNDLLQNNFPGFKEDSYAPIAVVLSFALLYTLRPYFLHKHIFNNSPFQYFFDNLVCYFIVLSMSILFVEATGDVSSTKIIALLISAFSYFLFYNVSVTQVRNLELESSI